MKSLNPHLTFPGFAREAMNFYQTVFGGVLSLVPLGERQDSGLPPDALFHSELKGHHFSIMAADSPSVLSIQAALNIQCDDESEIKKHFVALAEGGSIHCEICPAFGGLYAEVTDRFGVRWFLTLPNDPPRNHR
jgi:PhnB protein